MGPRGGFRSLRGSLGWNGEGFLERKLLSWLQGSLRFSVPKQCSEVLRGLDGI